jgi:hypothetical protein
VDILSWGKRKMLNVGFSNFENIENDNSIMAFGGLIEKHKIGENVIDELKKNR